MIHEFAIDPELVVYWSSDRDEYKRVYGQIGLGQPRILSEYPKLKHWRRAVLHGLPKDDVFVCKRIEELVRLLSECRVKRDSIGFDGNRSWLENAETEHGRCPFNLILSVDNPRKNGRVLSKELIGEPDDARYCLPPTLAVSRTPKALADALRPMLANCSTAYFIDPHFAPNQQRYRQSMAAFFRALTTKRPGAIPSEVVVLSKKIDQGHDFFNRYCETYMPRILPTGLSVRFRRIQSKPGGPTLHNRYILTDIGGVSLAHGLDRGNATDREDIALLAKDHFKEKWRDYVDPGVFNIVGEVYVQGSRGSSS